MGKSDQNRIAVVNKAPKAPVYHSMASEHFEGAFPLFMNRYQEGFELREHAHAYLEIVYVFSGEGYHYVGSKIERTSKGYLYILPVGTSHIFRPSGVSPKSALLVYNLCIRPEFIDQLGEWLSQYCDSGVLLTLFKGEPGTHLSFIDHGMELVDLFERMFREFTDKQMGYETSLFSTLLQLTVTLTRRLNGHTSDGPPQHGRMNRSELTHILNYIDTHRTEVLTVEHLAERAGMSRRHFIRVFRQAAGMGFSEYLQLKRIEYACRLLLNTDYKIALIAKSTGYKDSAHFRGVFRKLIGTSPNKYRAGTRSMNNCFNVEIDSPSPARLD
ncbi:AraC-like DNA-binding protein/quercetin dioxygenase-like cupin family protein [Paenibacillus mucilaginosus]|uniref:helix-turn-helix domain-containing protein n=1 Tax=Paenibacillus mucilaginosus TaxID=61624 RepID=UPI003D1C6AAD